MTKAQKILVSTGMVSVLAVSGLMFAVQASADTAPRKCDANGDGNITAADLLIIRNANGQAATGPDDPRDGNSDGGINVLDYRYCQLRLGQ